MNDIDNIRRCARDLDLFLSKIERDYGLCISLHTSDAFLEFLKNEQTHNLHKIHYCELVKCAKHSISPCMRMQRFVTASFDRSPEPRFGRCVFGVDEFVIPAFSRGKAIGFISVSGYSFDRAETRRRAESAFGNISPELERAISELKPVAPDPETLKTLLMPAADLLGTIYFRFLRGGKMPNWVYSAMISYISKHYCEPLTVKQVARAVNCSESFINHSFKRKNGCSFSSYLNSLRVKHAKDLLVGSARSVSDIAYLVGFNDANYFSSVFKKENGVSPLEFRGRFQK